MIMDRKGYPVSASPVDEAFDRWFAARRHELPDETVSRRIWEQGWAAASALFAKAYQREEDRADRAEREAEELRSVTHDAVAAERAVCAAICDAEGAEWDSDAVVTEKNYAAHCANRIRARSKF